MSAVEVVKLRTRSRVYTSPPCGSRSSAEEIRLAIAHKVADIGGGWALIDFVDRDGRPASVRARDVVAIERATIPPPLPPGPPAEAMEEQAALDVPIGGHCADVTDWLRSRTKRGQALEQFADMVVDP